MLTKEGYYISVCLYVLIPSNKGVDRIDVKKIYIDLDSQSKDI